MKRIHLASICTAAFVALVAPVHAADMPIAKASAPATATVGKGPVPIFNWSGFYVGVQGGYGWGKSDNCDEDGACLGAFDIKGWHGGGTLGWNWQSGMWVAGVEADYSSASIDGIGVETPIYGNGKRVFASHHHSPIARSTILPSPVAIVAPQASLGPDDVKRWRKPEKPIQIID
jgi:opacity protein-like surface antigen